MAKWVECGRDAHGLNITVLGLWNEVLVITIFGRDLDLGSKNKLAFGHALGACSFVSSSDDIVDGCVATACRPGRRPAGRRVIRGTTRLRSANDWTARACDTYRALAHHTRAPALGVAHTHALPIGAITRIPPPYRCASSLQTETSPPWCGRCGATLATGTRCGGLDSTTQEAGRSVRACLHLYLHPFLLSLSLSLSFSFSLSVSVYLSLSLCVCVCVCVCVLMLRGTTQDERGLGLPLWSSEDYSTYSG